MLQEHLCIVYNNNNNINNNNNNNNNNYKVRENLSRRKPLITQKFCISYEASLGGLRSSTGQNLHHLVHWL